MPRSALTPPPATPQDHDSPLATAICAQDRRTLAFVEQALETGRVLLAFQPVVQAHDPGRIAFYEGLIRLLDDTGRVIPARDFIETVETHEWGRIIDCLALEQGLQALAREPSLRLSINMSARSLGYPDWMATLREGLSHDDTIAERLILEITERSAMLMPDLVTRFMSDLHAQGVSFALDDFGAGQTTFRYLRDFHFDILKIDGQFIRGIAGSADDQVLTAALISVAQHFDMFTVAESVETQTDAQLLAQMGIDCLQGYLFGAPSVHHDARRNSAPRSA